MNNSVVLLSGGIDSSTVLAFVKKLGHNIFCLTFNYEQRHKTEIICAQEIAKYYQVAHHRIINIDFNGFDNSALISGIGIPENRKIQEMLNEIPNTYIPGRNILFLSYALSWADYYKANNIFIGANSLDQFGYPDCKKEFLAAFEVMANLGTQTGIESGIKISSPLISLSKTEVVKLGLSLGVDFSLTSSCYAPLSLRVACGKCDACIIRKEAFREIGIEDPTKYT